MRSPTGKRQTFGGLNLTLGAVSQARISNYVQILNLSTRLSH